MLKKRHDLIPNLVSTVKSYMSYESNLLEKIVELRNFAMKPGISDEQKFQAEGAISDALGKVNLAFENYPDLRASENFAILQRSLNEVEEQISAARRTYNGAVMNFNNNVEKFPSNVMAGIMNYERKPSFEVAPGESDNIDVASLLGN